MRRPPAAAPRVHRDVVGNRPHHFGGVAVPSDDVRPTRLVGCRRERRRPSRTSPCSRRSRLGAAVRPGYLHHCDRARCRVHLGCRCDRRRDRPCSRCDCPGSDLLGRRCCYRARAHLVGCDRPSAPDHRLSCVRRDVRSEPPWLDHLGHCSAERWTGRRPGRLCCDLDRHDVRAVDGAVHRHRKGRHPVGRSGFGWIGNECWLTWIGMRTGRHHPAAAGRSRKAASYGRCSPCVGVPRKRQGPRKSGPAPSRRGRLLHYGQASSARAFPRPSKPRSLAGDRRHTTNHPYSASDSTWLTRSTTPRIACTSTMSPS